MNYVVRYRGGPLNRQVQQLQTLLNEMSVYRVPNRPRAGDSLVADDYDPFKPVDYKMGVYSRVYTPMKNGQYIYVWVEQ